MAWEKMDPYIVIAHLMELERDWGIILVFSLHIPVFCFQKSYSLILKATKIDRYMNMKSKSKDVVPSPLGQSHTLPVTSHGVVDETVHLP
jgi:hypothetical protein